MSRLALAGAVLLAAAPLAAQEKLDPKLRGLLLRPPAAGAFTPAGVTAGPAPRVRLFVRLAPGADAAGLRARFPAGAFHAPVGGVVTAELPLSDVPALAADPAVAAAQAARSVRLLLDVVRSSITSGGVWLGALDAVSVDFGTNLGSGVVVGFVDSGIDYKHADFYTEGSPNRTRILALWDQTISSHAGGPFPAGFTYGAAYARSQVDDEIDGSPAGVIQQVDTVGHGTHVAGIAAGDGSATDGDLPAGTFKGIAPEADIVMVKSDLSDTGILDGISFIVSTAAAAGKRAVINLSLGGHYGPHDGTSSLETGVGAVAASTPVIVAMGNEQDLEVHASTTLPVLGSSALFTVSADAGETSWDADFWVPNGDTYTVEVTTSATGSAVSCAFGGDCTGLSLAGHTVDLYNSAVVHPSNDREVYVYVERVGGLSVLDWRVRLTRTAAGGSGRVDGWVTNQFSSFTALVDSSGTVSSPATADSVVAVGSYCSKRQWTANSLVGFTDSACSASLLGDISIFSNRGPTRDGRQKPDLAAPGHRVGSSLSADEGLLSTDPTMAVDARHKYINGTSMAAPVVAGALARTLVSTPSATAAAMLSTLRSQARTDAKVTSWGSVPNPVFGYGKLRISGCGDSLAAPVGASAQTHGTSSMTWTWLPLSGADTYNVYYGTNPASLIGSVASPSILLTLDANTTTSVRVAGVNPCGEGPGTTSGSSSTLAVPITSFSVAPWASSATVSWTPLPPSPRPASSEGYLVEASLSPAFTSVKSSATTVVGVSALTVSGLDALTTYYFRLATLSEVGGAHFSGAEVAFTSTTLVPPGPGPFSVLGQSSITASWTLNGNPAGLEYIAQASTAADFSGSLSQSQGFGLSLTLTGLSANSTYHFRVRATTGPFGSMGSTATLASVPGAGSPPFTAVFQTSVAVSWSGSAARFRAELAASQDFLLSPQSSVTAGTSALFTGLNRNTTYYLRVAALNVNSVPSAYSAAQASSTLTSAPSPGTPSILAVGPSSVTVSWTALPAFPIESSCEGYLAQGSTSPDFSGTRHEARTANPSATSISVPGLLQDNTYYFRVGALNWNGLANFTTLGSTLTFGILTATGSVNPGGDFAQTIAPSVPELALVSAAGPPGTFPSGTQITIVATFVGGLPPPVTNQGSIALLSGNAGVDISAGGLQPSVPVTLRFTYVPAALGGIDPKRLVIGRHTGSGWTLLPTTLNPSAATLEAQTSHFSVFAPLVVTAGTSLDSVQVFPIPWKQGSGDGRFDAPGVSFTNLPNGGEVRVFTILGEEVIRLSAGPSGIVLWDGRNQQGRRVGSGTYLAVLSGAGARRLVRVAVVR